MDLVALAMLGFWLIVALTLGSFVIYAVIFAVGGIGYGLYWIFCKLTGKEIE
jgi:hypothetical protein